MTGLGLLLLGVGVTDAVAGGLPGHPPVRTWAGVVGGASAVAVLGLLAGLGAVSLAWALGTGAVTALWVSSRRRDPQSERAAWVSLGLLATAAVGALALGAATPPTDGSPLAALLTGSDVPGLASTPPASFVFLLGAVVAMGATGNALVRVVLVLAGPDVARSRSRLRGGRLIGPLERFLILGLALAGEPTAASLVVAAKSILRFPELASVARREDRGERLDRVDAVTEYVLIGSLVSWAVALAPVALLG